MAPPPSISLVASRSEGPHLSEDERLGGLYERLRERLLDLTNRNPMLNARVSPDRRSRRQVRIVNVALEAVYQALRGDEPRVLDILALAEPGDIPPDELTEAFLSALDHARLTDGDYLEAIAKLEANGTAGDTTSGDAEETLRLKLRVELGLAERPMRYQVDRAAHARRLGLNPDPELALRDAVPASEAPRLQTLRYAGDLEEVLDRIADATRLATQETGMSTLFLAFGFLERPDADRGGKTFRAPLLLLPVEIVTRKADGREVPAIAAVADMETNLSLGRFMERDFRRELPDFEPVASEQDRDEIPATVGGYFEGVARAIEGLTDWHIRPWLVLGSFAFGRYQIYHDLQAQNWTEPPVSHPLVRAILAGTDQPGAPADFAAATDYDIDASDIQREVPHLIADADSSQHSALVDVARQKNLVIEGPPGTGKSQTITNIIAHAIGQGKKVLFLSEKQAALDVVRLRLGQAGLGPFCLELHSDTAVPRSLIEAVKDRVELGWGQPRSVPKPADATLVEARQSIGRYLENLHELQPDGETPFRLMWQSIRGARGREAVHEALRHLSPGGDWFDDPDRLQAMRDAVEIYALSAGEFEARHGPVGASPWSRTGLNDVPTYDLLRLRAALTLWREPMLEAVALVREGADLGLVTLADLGRLIEIDAGLGQVGGAAYLAAVAEAHLASMADVLPLLAEIADIEARIAATPDLVLTPRAATARAADLVASRFGAALGPNVPADLSRSIRIRVDGARELIAAVEGLMPALSVLGLDRTRSAEVFTDIALLCRALASMTTARRAQFLAFRGVTVESLGNVRKRYQDLVSAADDWRRHFPGLDPLRLPRVADIRAATVWLRRGGVSRALAGMGGEARSARTLIEVLMAGPGLPDPDLLAQLADFVAYCDAFRDDAAIRRPFGRDWQGIATPFADIEACLKVRRAFRQALTQALGSAEVIDHLFELGDDGMAALVAQGTAAERFLALTPEARMRLKAFTLGSAIPHLEAEIRVAAALADLAGDPVLMSIERPLQVIADYHHARDALAGLQQDLAATGHADAVAGLVGDGDPREAAAAAVWIGKVRASPLADDARLALMGPRAVEVRARMSRIATVGLGTLARLRVAAEETEAAFGWFNLDAGDPAMLLAQIDALIANHGQLADFLVLRRLKLELAADGLGVFLDTAERFRLPMAELPQLFATLVARNRADHARRTTSLVRSTGMEMEVRRRIFAERDRQRIAIDQAEIRARLTELPELKPVPGNNLGPKSTWTELALLNSELAKSARYLPIRTVLARAGRSIQALMPCLMASPLSLAKFATPGKLAFDLVVIDEASQMRPEDALGGLLRAKQVVVVGDPRQLPPTDFFRRGEPESFDSDDEIDAESILEVCARSFGTVRRLKWHYRSRCESLIAFSNREFYRDSLITFPSNRPDAFSIDLIRVNGIYRNRRNPDEAARVAEEAVRFMRQFATNDHCPTLGIATLNMEQRDLIREELRRISIGDELVEIYMTRVAARGEPVFVKNLENVQGDERDYVLVSLVRGPAPGTGVVAQTFGPIGGRHGARRLNVLFTRARVRIGIFASFGSEDVLAAETSSPGVHVLKRYLRYAEERGRAPAISEAEEPDSDFEQEVADRLALAGFEVALQVGVSSYRIDLGVRHPDRPGTFLAGIECDGARYHSSKAARDRDRLREEILRGLGWDLIRVWSTDWFADPEEETRRLIRRLDLLRVVPDRIDGEYRFGPATERRVEEDMRDVEAVVAEVAHDDGSAQLTLNLSDSPQFAEITDDIVQISSDGAPAEIAPVDPLSGGEPPHEPVQAIFEGFDEAANSYIAGPEETALASDRIWRPERLTEALISFRETEIFPAFPDGDRQRSILRSGMIETFINEHVVDAGEWESKVPRYQRLGTNAAELRFLDQICGLVAKLG